MHSQSIHLYLTSEHECGYLPDRVATNLVPDPKLKMNMAMYSQLITLGYRRSGQFTYRPHCDGCTACIPCRVPVDQFMPRRNQKRCSRLNQDLAINVVRAHYSRIHFELYKRYINARHADGDMVDPSPDDYQNFLYSDWSDTWFMEARLDGKLIAVTVYDQVEDGLSAVYSFFDPDYPQRSLGTFNITKLIEHARLMELDFVYMGYLINGCDKMQYKSSFQPLQQFVDNLWMSRRVTG